MSERKLKMKDIMEEDIIVLSAVPLQGTTILPGMVVHFDIQGRAAKLGIAAAMRHQAELFFVVKKDGKEEKENTLKNEDLREIGTIAKIRQVRQVSSDAVRIVAEGSSRAKLCRITQTDPYMECEVALIPEDDTVLDPEIEEAMVRTLQGLFAEYMANQTKVTQETAARIKKEENLSELCRMLSVELPITWKQRQRMLEALTKEARYEVVCGILMHEIGILKIQQEIQGKVKERVDKNQREYILREQIKVIREELGDEGVDTEADEFEKKLDALDVSEEVREKLHREIDRFRRMNPMFAEMNVQRTYLETVFELPWGKKTEDSDDLARAEEILEEDHYGLKDVKERILEFLSVRILTNKGKSPILCLVGPPGTGKTSIAKSVARALNKKYVRICLGGVYDEAQIRGHRRTYVGALPGDLTGALRTAKVSNPLVLLDEIDKTGKDIKGDVSSALLEVLDPEQNSRFVDHYVEVPQDLSEVLFIATANDINGIPRPLRDRMEIVEIPGYSENEKLHIAKEHLIPKQKQENGIDKGCLVIQDSALRRMINNYTKESGVRSLERLIGRICRKTARRILSDGEDKVKVTGKNLDEFLGKSRYTYLMANKKNQVGIVRGLAWTQFGGDTMEIEVNIMPGKGEVAMTGQLGDIMKESAKAGVSYIRSVAKDYHIDPEFFGRNDLHIHIPEGAVPKDGPSAGITMATAMLSAITGRPVHADVAMTGEITLRGRVLAIGGLREKLLAAKYAHLKKILVPKDNRPDIEEMDKEITEGLEIVFVSEMEEVLAHALCAKKH